MAFWIWGPALLGLLTDLPEIIEASMEYLPWVIAAPLIAFWAYLYDGVFVGATRAREMRDNMVLSTFIVFLPAWYLLRPFDNHGLWLAFLVFRASRGLGMHIYDRRRVLPGLPLTSDPE